MSDVLFVVTIIAFFTVAAAMVWACFRITSDAGDEAALETNASGPGQERT